MRLCQKIFQLVRGYLSTISFFLIDPDTFPDEKDLDGLQHSLHVEFGEWSASSLHVCIFQRASNYQRHDVRDLSVDVISFW